MKLTKRIIPLLMCIVMFTIVMCTTVYAANGEANISATSDMTTVEIQQEFTVTVAFSDCTLTAIKAGLTFDTEMLEATSVTIRSITYYSEEEEDDVSVPATAKSDVNTANSNGIINGVYAFNGGRETDVNNRSNLFTIKFKAKKAGTTVITLFEESAGPDSCRSDNVQQITLTIKEATPPCVHSKTYCNVNYDTDTHQVFCCSCNELVTTVKAGSDDSSLGCLEGVLYHDFYCNYCDLTINSPTCTDSDGDGDHYCDICGKEGDYDIVTDHKGGTATCTEKATCDECEQPYGTALGHIDVNPKDHKCDRDCGKTDMGDHKSNAKYACQDGICEYCGEAVAASANHNTVSGGFLSNGNGTHIQLITCDVCKDVVEEIPGECSGGTATCKEQATCEECVETYGEKNPNNHASTEITYVDINAYTHTVKHVCCGNTDAAVDHNYDTTTHKCVCDKVEEYTLTVFDMPAATSNTEPKKFTVPYGTNILDFIDGKVNLDPQTVETDTMNGKYIWIGTWVDRYDWSVLNNDSIVTGNMEINVESTFHGWQRTSTDDPWSYLDENGVAVKEGWYEIDGEWYYFLVNETTGWNYTATGLTRVPYPTEEINGITYAPNAEDIAYYANKGETFIDEKEAWFYFDENGKFIYNDNHYIRRGDSFGMLVNGMLAWHPGLIKIAAGEYAYFIGDEENGGNKPANGDTYIIRANGIEGFAYGEVYNFVDGRPSGADGIVDGKYYENSKLMMGAGLKKLDEGYIYVRSNGQLATGMYWVTKTNGLVNAGTYNFGTDGILVSDVDPSVTGLVDGVYYKNGMPYYAGLIEIDGEIYYVKSNGHVATGTYYVTKTNDMEGFNKGDKLIFDDDGKMETIKNGIVEENGALYYYENNHITYAGLIEIDGSIIYVRSNGQLAVGKYYVTKVNTLEGYTAGQKLYFGEDGKLVK